MRPELPNERGHGLADGVMLLAILCVVILTWGSLARSSAVPVWKFHCGVGVVFVLALAGLTRRARWADTIKLMMGIWMIIAPFIPGLAETTSALCACLATGCFLTMLSVRGAIGEHGRAAPWPGRRWGALSLPR